MLKDFTKEAFDIVIQAGQSNAEGSGFGDAAMPYQPKDNVYMMEPDRTVFKAREIVWDNVIRGNFALSFADAYLNAGLLREGRKLLILRTAVGGTGFSDGRWGKTDPLFLQMLDMTREALSLNPENRVVCLLWHQGETDAINRMDYDTYKKNLHTLISLTRAAFGPIPFIEGDFVQQWIGENEDICRPIRAAMRDVCAEAEGCAFVETDGLPSNDQSNKGCGDTIHFSRQALYLLGQRYFEAYRDLRAD